MKASFYVEFFRRDHFFVSALLDWDACFQTSFSAKAVNAVSLPWEHCASFVTTQLDFPIGVFHRQKQVICHGQKCNDTLLIWSNKENTLSAATPLDVRLKIPFGKEQTQIVTWVKNLICKLEIEKYSITTQRSIDYVCVVSARADEINRMFKAVPIEKKGSSLFNVFKRKVSFFL
jgi:hypothetical protein